MVSRARYPFWLPLLSLAALLSCKPNELARTEIVLVIDSDLRVPDELDELAIYVEGPGGRVQEASARLEETPLPRSLGLLRTQGPLSPVNVRVTGRVRGEDVLERRASLSFVEGRTLLLPMHLARSCLESACGEQTCTEHGCRQAAIDPRSLADWDGKEPTLIDGPGELPASDGGEELPLDAGSEETDSAIARDGGDATAGGDGGTRDGGRDAGADAGPAPRDGGADARVAEGGACTPSPELCNGRDDDCNGTVDDGFQLSSDTRNCGSCGNLCGGSARECCDGICRRSCF
jgi:hypothetical protein